MNNMEDNEEKEEVKNTKFPELGYIKSFVEVKSPQTGESSF